MLIKISCVGWGVLIGPGMVDANVKSNIACSLHDCQWQSLVGKEWVGY